MIRLDRTACLIVQGDVIEVLALATGTLTALSGRQRQGIIIGRARSRLSTVPVGGCKRARMAIDELADLLADTNSDTVDIGSGIGSDDEGEEVR